MTLIVSRMVHAVKMKTHAIANCNNDFFQKENTMKKTIKNAVAVVLLVGFAVLALGSMGSSPSSSRSSSSGGSSSGSSSIVTYTYYNNSSHDVFVNDRQNPGNKLIRKGDSLSVRGSPGATTSSFTFSPQGLVTVSQSGNTFTFSDATY